MTLEYMINSKIDADIIFIDFKVYQYVYNVYFSMYYNTN